MDDVRSLADRNLTFSGVHQGLAAPLHTRALVCINSGMASNRRDDRSLRDLVSVGASIERDFHLMGIHTVARLATADPDALYRSLCRKTRTHQDPCVLDTFRAAVAQARNPDLPNEQCQWWYWSRLRKSGALPDVYWRCS